MKNRNIVLILISSLFVCFYLFFVTYDEAKEKAISDLVSRQQILAEQAKSEIEYFFNNTHQFAKQLTRSDHIVIFDEIGKNEMGLAFSLRPKGIRAITRVSKKGRIIYTMPENKSVINSDISYQAHVKKILSTHKPVVSDVFQTVQGYRAIAMHVPVFHENQYQGSLAILIDFLSISKRSLENIRIGETGYAWMTSQNGIELYCPIPGHAGNSVFENCKEFPTIIAMAQKMVAGQKGITTYKFDRIKNRRLETVEKHAVFLPINILDTFWTIVVASSEKEVLATLVGFKNKLIFIISLLLIFSFIFSYFSVKAWGIVREEEKRRKAQELLKKSEERYREIVEGTENLVTEVDVEGKITFVNIASLKVFGLSPEECIGRKAFDFIHEEDQEKTIEKFSRWMVEKPESATFENRQLNRTTGESRDMLWSINFVYDDKGEIFSIKSIARDITEHKQTLEALQKSKEYLASVFRAVPSGVVILQERNFTMINDRIFEILGYSRDELLGKSTRILYFSDEAYENAGKIIYSDIAAQGYSANEFLMRHKSNREIQVLITSSELGCFKESKMSVHCILDITDRKKTLEALQKSEQFLAGIFHTVPTGIGIFKDRRIVTVNERLCEITGYSQDELIGQSSRLLYTSEGEYHRCGKEIYSQVKKHGRCSVEAHLVKKDGQNIHVLINASPLLPKTGDKDIITSILDITMRKQAIDELRQSQEFLASIFKTVHSGIAVLERRKFTFVNERVTEIFGYSKEELIGRATRFLYFTEDEYNAVGENISNQIQTHGFSSMEVRLRHKSGREVQILLTSAALKTSNGSQITIDNILDITKRKKDEEELKRYQQHLEEIVAERTEKLSKANADLKVAKEEADSANKAKSDFLANMSHEIRTPLNAVTGFSELLSTLVTDEKQKSYLEAIKKAGKNLLLLINDILDLSKIEAGKIEIQYSTVSIKTILDEIEQIFSLQASRKNIQFQIHIKDKMPPIIFLDETRIRQILLNIVGNAVKFTEKGFIRISVETFAKTTDKKLLDITISVEDTGIGISKADIDTIFDSFKQQSDQNAVRYGGTGLGLSICKRLIEMMNGQITAESTIGKGSIFKITLKDVMAKVGEAPAFDKRIDHHNIRFKNAKVLVVDDIKSNRDLVCELLTNANLDVITAQNGHEAILICPEYLPDLILMDIRMPVMDGYEAMQQIRKNVTTKHIPVVAITASSLMGERNKILEKGFDGFLSKPVELNELLSELSKFLNVIDDEDDSSGFLLQKESMDILNPLSDNAFLKLPQIINTLETEFKEKWKQFQNRLPMNEVRIFGKGLNKLGEKFENEIVSNYGQGLLSHADNFDVDGMRAEIDKFSELITKLKSLNQENI